MSCNNFSAVFRVVTDVETKDVKGQQLSKCRAVHDYSYKENSSVFMGLTFWGNKGSAASKLISKGDVLFVTGNLTFREYEGKTYMDVNVYDFSKVSSNKSMKSDSKPKKGEKTAPVGVDVEEEIPF